MKAKLIRLVLTVFSRLSLSVARGVGVAVGSICWWLNTRDVKVTRVNLGIAFPGYSEKKRRQLAKESIKEWGKSLFEIPVVWGHSRSWLEKKVVNQCGVKFWEQYRNNGKGLIVVVPHLGNWEVVGLTCSAQAGEMTNMFAPSGNEAVDSFIRDARSRFGGILVPTNKKGVMALIKSLRAGGVIGILPDQVPPVSGGVYSPFFGVSALTMSLIHNLIKRSGAKVLFAYAKRVAGGFELVYLEPNEEIYSEDQQCSVDALNEGVEQCVLAAITQYQWEYKRFKRRPEGEASFYTKENT